MVSSRVARWFFSNQKSKLGEISEGLAMEDVGIFYGHLVHFTVFCYILWTFGIVRGNLVHFSRFGILYQEKSGSPGFFNVDLVRKFNDWRKNFAGF
jgi:hypothetical protein